MFADGEGAPPPQEKILEAYMDELVWLNPPEAERQGIHGHGPNMWR